MNPQPTYEEGIAGLGRDILVSACGRESRWLSTTIRNNHMELRRYPIPMDDKMHNLDLLEKQLPVTPRPTTIVKNCCTKLAIGKTGGTRARRVMLSCWSLFWNAVARKGFSSGQVNCADVPNRLQKTPQLSVDVSIHLWCSLLWLVHTVHLPITPTIVYYQRFLACARPTIVVVLREVPKVNIPSQSVTSVRQTDTLVLQTPSRGEN
ncbi:hypothetical protein DL95DRAFT_129620 [Leptodontidium sp. 2 PMI_412]|nr:hypothetical protein DL95DRAFT_129620 [Leptodontidium sp. 2 PMI_412]